jgi:uridine phosphorylase
MMDFVVRETAGIVDGEMAIVRLGTCGAIGSSSPGNIVVATGGSAMVRLEPDFLLEGAADDPAALPRASCPYSLSKVVASDEELSETYAAAIERELAATKGSEGDVSKYHVTRGVGVTADSFYSSQGRQTGLFDDRSEGLIDELEKRIPEAACLEMETFQLVSLARHSFGKIKASSAAIPVSVLLRMLLVRVVALSLSWFACSLRGGTPRSGLPRNTSICSRRWGGAGPSLPSPASASRGPWQRATSSFPERESAREVALLIQFAQTSGQ